MDNGNGKEDEGNGDSTDVKDLKELLNLETSSTPGTKEQLRILLEGEEFGPAVIREMRNAILARQEGACAGSHAQLTRSPKKQRLDLESTTEKESMHSVKMPYTLLNELDRTTSKSSIT